MYVLAQRNRKFIEARSINYQRRTFRDRNREPRSISTRKFSMIRETRIVEKGSTIKERHASSLPFSPNDKFVCSVMRKGGDRSSCRGVSRGQDGEGGGARKTAEARGTPLLTQTRGQPSSANVTNLVKAFWSK